MAHCCPWMASIWIERINRIFQNRAVENKDFGQLHVFIRFVGTEMYTSRGFY